MIRNARDHSISIMSGSDTGNALAFSHGRWHGTEAELFVEDVGMPPTEQSSPTLAAMPGSSASKARSA
jgi:hypothetical protein